MQITSSETFNRAAGTKWLIDQTGRRFFRITWYKNNGELKSCLAQVGVKKHQQGMGRDIDEDRYRIIWSHTDGGYRTVNLSRVVEVRCGEIQFDVTELVAKLKREAAA